MKGAGMVSAGEEDMCSWAGIGVDCMGSGMQMGGSQRYVDQMRCHLHYEPPALTVHDQSLVMVNDRLHPLHLSRSIRLMWEIRDQSRPVLSNRRR